MKSIVLLSVPFVAGVAAATLIRCPETAALHAACLLGSLAFVAAWHKDSGKRTVGALFFLLGCFCAMTTGQFGDLAAPDSAGRVQASLCRLIDSVPWPHEETAGLLRAVLTGSRDGLGRETVAVFRASGASHILALSGLHLGIIYLIIGKLLLPLGNGRAAAVVRSSVLILLCAFYTIVTGASPSIVRAFLFICINEAASHSPGRRKDGVSVLCTALLLQLAVSPGVISSLGFQLSYLAMTGIFTIYPKIEGWYPKSRRLRRDPLAWIWRSFALTLSCQLFTAPLVWIRFHTFPKYFIITNLLALPLTWAMVVSAVLTLSLFACGVPVRQLVTITDNLAHALISALEIVSGM